MVICLERGADLHIAQLMPLPLTVSCFSKIQIGFTFLVPFWYRLTRVVSERAVKRVCVYCTDLGPCIRHAEVISNGSREYSAWCRSESTPAVSVLRRRRQASQVLGPRVQQGRIRQLLCIHSHKRRAFCITVKSLKR